MSDANGFLFFSTSLGLVLLKILLTVFLKRRQHITISRKRRIWESCFFSSKSYTLLNIIIFFTLQWLWTIREQIKWKQESSILHTSMKWDSSFKRPVIAYIILIQEWLQQGQYHLKNKQKTENFLITDPSLKGRRVKKSYPIFLGVKKSLYDRV